MSRNGADQFFNLAGSNEAQVSGKPRSLLVEQPGRVISVTRGELFGKSILPDRNAQDKYGMEIDEYLERLNQVASAMGLTREAFVKNAAPPSPLPSSPPLTTDPTIPPLPTDSTIPPSENDELIAAKATIAREPAKIARLKSALASVLESATLSMDDEDGEYSTDDEDDEYSTDDGDG